jgi:hypothetical protein
MTVAQEWRFRRNLCIYAGHLQGFSQRMLADVFDLPRSRVAEILKATAAIWPPDPKSTGMKKPNRAPRSSLSAHAAAKNRPVPATDG